MAEEEEQLQLELDWCVAQLEAKLALSPPGSRGAMDTEKVIRILRSPKTPLGRKRQAMHNTFGDYRQKIRALEKKATAAVKKTQFIQDKSPSEASKFLRHSLTSASNRHASSGSPSSKSTSSLSPVQQPERHDDAFAVSSLVQFHDASIVQQKAFPNTLSSTVGSDLEMADSENPSAVQMGEKTSNLSCAGEGFQYQPSQNEFRFNFEASSLRDAEEDDDKSCDETL